MKARGLLLSSSDRPTLVTRTRIAIRAHSGQRQLCRAGGRSGESESFGRTSLPAPSDTKLNIRKGTARKPSRKFLYHLRTEHVWSDVACSCPSLNRWRTTSPTREARVRRLSRDPERTAWGCAGRPFGGGHGAGRRARAVARRGSSCRTVPARRSRASSRSQGSLWIAARQRDCPPSPHRISTLFRAMRFARPASARSTRHLTLSWVMNRIPLSSKWW